MEKKHRVLIAEHGEMAIKIIRALKKLGIRSVASYSDVDKDSPFVELADETVCVGPGLGKEIDLTIFNIIQAALLHKVTAVYPNRALLIKNSKFREICKAHGLIVIDPIPKKTKTVKKRVELALNLKGV